jgi:diamine N-acetyltransferase
VSEIDIRPATAEDLPALSALAVQTFEETFAHLYAPEDLETFLRASYAPEVLASEISNPDHFWRVAWEGDTPVGYVQACPVGLPHTEADPSSQGELKRLYVTASQHGRGLGRELLARSLAYLTGRYGGAPQWIGVWSENHKAQAIYRAQGFEKVGEYGFNVGAATDREFILRRG